jgi:hypothetical protein
MSRLLSRLILLAAAIGLIWWAFFRPKKLAGTQVGTVGNIGAQASAAASSAISTTSNSANQGISQIIGVISNGVATSIGNWFNQPGGQGGTNGSATNTGDGSFLSTDPPLVVDTNTYSL